MSGESSIAGEEGPIRVNDVNIQEDLMVLDEVFNCISDERLSAVEIYMVMDKVETVQLVYSNTYEEDFEYKDECICLMWIYRIAFWSTIICGSIVLLRIILCGKPNFEVAFFVGQIVLLCFLIFLCFVGTDWFTRLLIMSELKIKPTIFAFLSVICAMPVCMFGEIRNEQCEAKLSKKETVANMIPKFCVNCGNELEEESVFCQYCGKKVNDL